MMALLFGIEFHFELLKCLNTLYKALGRHIFLVGRVFLFSFSEELATVVVFARKGACYTLPFFCHRQKGVQNQ
jgi:hypothetical protein